MSTYRCPKCEETKGLYRTGSMPAFEPLDEFLDPEGTPEVDGTEFDPDGLYGCGECGWTGNKDGLARLGLDGQPIPRPLPGQMV